ARTALALLLRRWLFWGLYALCAMIFLFYFYGQYLQTWLTTLSSDEPIRFLGGMSIKTTDLIKPLKEAMHLDGTGFTYRGFFWSEGQIVMIVLALAGSILIGNDFRFGALPFYLAKPLGRWHYLGGKWLAVGVFVNLMTTLPALILFVEYGLLD